MSGHASEELPGLRVVASARGKPVNVDIEAATRELEEQGYRLRVPYGTLLCVSDKPLHGRPKLSDAAQLFYRTTRTWHVEIAVEVLGRVREMRHKYADFFARYAA